MSRIGLIALAGFAACLPARAIEDNRRPRTGNVAVESCLGSSYGLDEKGFVRDWLVCGPFPNYLKGDGHLGFETDFLDGESWVKPRAGDVRKVLFEADLSALVTQIGGVNEWGFKETRTFDAAWRELHSEMGVVSLNRRFLPIDDHFVAYAACYVDSPRDLGCLIFCGSDDDSRVWVNSKEVGASATSQGAIPGYFKYSVTLKKGRNRILMKICDRDADCGFCVQFVAHRTYQPLTELSVTLDPGAEAIVLDRERAYECTPANIAKKRADLDRRKAAAVAEIAALEQESVALSNGVAAAERRLEAASAQLEARYAREHAAAAAKGASSVDEPLAADATRRELLLNGDWEASVSGKTWTDRFRLPAHMPSAYYASWYWPVKPSDPKNRFSKPVWANDAFADRGAFPRYYYEPRSRFRTTFDWNGEGEVIFRAEAIVGAAEVFANGVKCGAYDGLCGVWRVPLTAAKKGRNVLELRYEQRPRAYHRGQMLGIRGDLYVEFVPSVRTEEVYVKPSWRTALLATETVLTNAGPAAVSAEVRAYAVKDGRIRLRLPIRRLTLAPGAAETVASAQGWADPLPWGPGGVYGKPDQYELVTDVFAGGRLVDRHRQPFGFREFWIKATDFFLNGRRIVLQGDVGNFVLGNRRSREIGWTLLRADGINTIRYHDNDYWCVNAVADADRLGMLTYAQCYPVFTDSADKEVTPAMHDFNRANYVRWWKSLRNHPSVVVWSLDNEVFTQGKHQPNRIKKGMRDDACMAEYEKWLHGVDPSLVLTRDGDGGTWYPSEKTWTDPPAMTANYHYPDYSIDRHVANWRKVFDYRPAIFGETLYCSYGAFDQNVGAIPDKVARKARKVRDVAGLYRRLGVPAPIFMGLGSDGFVQRDDTGKGNPFGLTERDHAAYAKDGTLPKGFAADEYPNARVRWPSMSGEGERILTTRRAERRYGCASVNWSDPRFPTHVRNLVNDAYRDALIPQAPLVTGTDAEALVTAAPGADVWSVDADGVRRGVRADAAGKAWFHFERAGRVTFSADGFAERTVEVAPRGEAVGRPGFGGLCEIVLKKGE